MSASWPGNMRVPRLKTPLLLLLLLVTSLTATAQDDETSDLAPEETEEEEGGPVDDDVEPTVNEEPSEVETTPETSPPSDISESETQSETEETQSGTEEAGSGTPDVTPNPATDETSLPPEDGELSLIIILIPVVLVVLIIGLIVCGIFINRRWNKSGRSQDLTKEDPYLDGSSTEKVPMPMFEEDVPSVLELEMEEFDQLMKKDGDTAENSTNA